jgi:hypothetical protein
VSETIEVTQVWLGMRPYVLIEAEADPADGELVLRVNAGGGAAEDVGALPFMMICELPADQNPITITIAEYLDGHPDHREALAGFAAALGVGMPDGAS